jgi:hypothetical protein
MREGVEIEGKLDQNREIFIKSLKNACQALLAIE